MSDAPTSSSFEPTACGSYLFRYGPAGKGAPHAQKKICLVATDAPFLVALLRGLSLRDDCHFVKYSAFTRDGMTLGRVFMTSDAAAGRLCQELKAHPKLFVSLQDDAFFSAFREPSGS